MSNILLRIFRRDQWINGFVSGLFLPVVLFAGLLYLSESIGKMAAGGENQSMHLLRPRTLALLALFANMVLMQSFKSLRWNQSMRGIAVSTFICVALWVIKYASELF